MCPVVGTISVELAIDCQPGYYCPQSTDPHPGSTIPAGNGIISTSPYEVPCPLGKYSDSYKATTVATCLACPAGYACPTLGTNKYTNPMVKCSPGYYCTGGDCSSASPTDGTCGVSINIIINIERMPRRNLQQFIRPKSRIRLSQMPSGLHMCPWSLYTYLPRSGRMPGREILSSGKRANNRRTDLPHRILPRHKHKA